MKLSIIVAVARNHAIGKENQLLWHISEDLKYFKKITSGHVVIMGRKTFESIGKPLPNRTNVVISRTMVPHEGVVVVPDLKTAIARYEHENELFIIGGGSVYREALPLAQRLYLTEVYADYEGDTFFPEIDKNAWHEISRTDYASGEKFPHPFSFVIYEK